MFFHTNTLIINLTISLFTIVLATSQFIVGPLTDIHGRRAVLLPGLLLFIGGSIICLSSSSIHWFLFGRFIQAFGISTGSVVAAAVIGDLYPPDTRGQAMSTYQTMVFLGPVVGPIVGSLIASEIRKRFSLEVIQELLEIKWWDSEIELINQYIGAIVSGNMDMLRKMNKHY